MRPALFCSCCFRKDSDFLARQDLHNHFCGDELPQRDIADRQQPTAQSDHAAMREGLKDDRTLVVRPAHIVGSGLTGRDLGLYEGIGFFEQQRQAVGGFEMEPVDADVL